jgi:hypothetical protein
MITLVSKRYVVIGLAFGYSLKALLIFFAGLVYVLGCATLDFRVVFVFPRPARLFEPFCNLLFPVSPPEFLAALLGLLLSSPMGTSPMLGATMLSFSDVIGHRYTLMKTALESQIALSKKRRESQNL